MKVERCVKRAFTVIGKEGSTQDGADFIARLWKEANGHFHEVQHLAKLNEDGQLAGIWGAMSDCSCSFKPWQDNFSRGLYLAGVECIDDAEAPEGWTKWVIPGFEFLRAEREDSDTFRRMLDYLREQELTIAGAVHDYICPKTGKQYMYFPIKKL